MVECSIDLNHVVTACKQKHEERIYGLHDDSGGFLVWFWKLVENQQLSCVSLSQPSVSLWALRLRAERPAAVTGATQTTRSDLIQR